jgi:ATP-dependent exoDNAse (exonuclease V) beta subunit
MTKDKLISLLKNPNNLTIDMLPELKEVAEQYPYFAQVHQLIARILNDTNDIQSEQYIQKAALYAADRSNLYHLLHPATNLAEPVKVERANRYSGNYFDLIDKVESQGGDARQSLKSLAERLKAARESIHGSSKKEVPPKIENAQTSEKPVEEQPKPIYIPTPDYFQVTEYNTTDKISEEYAKKLIRERKYGEAITILNELNLINPKKSIYFADQIRFLEKILVNIKK